MSLLKAIGILFVGLLVLIVAAFFLYEPVVNVDTLADCLTEKGVKMAGADWCGACKEQKSMFGDSFAKIDYKNCDYEEQWCLDNGITLFPTWVFSDGTQYRGVQNLGFLQEKAECGLVA